MELTSKQRANLRGQANGLDTIFQIGKDGIGDNLVKQIQDTLLVRELIKLRVLETALLTAKEACDEICKKTGAQPVQAVGSRFVIYKPNPKAPKILID